MNHRHTLAEQVAKCEVEKNDNRSTSTMKGSKTEFTRPIKATLHRPTIGVEATEVVWSRNYISLPNAIRRATELALIEGFVGDVVEFSSNITGLQLGTLKLSTNKSMQIEWSEFTLKAQKLVDSMADFSTALKGE